MKRGGRRGSLPSGKSQSDKIRKGGENHTVPHAQNEMLCFITGSVEEERELSANFKSNSRASCAATWGPHSCPACASSVINAVICFLRLPTAACH